MRTFVILKSSRAPYNRGGVHFPSRRASVIVEASLLSPESVELLRTDGAISARPVEIADDAEGDVFALAAKLAGVTAYSPFHPNLDPATREQAEGHKLDPTVEAARIAARAAAQEPPPSTVVVTDAENDAKASAQAEAAAAAVKAAQEKAEADAKAEAAAAAAKSTKKSS